MFTKDSKYLLYGDSKDNYSVLILMSILINNIRIKYINSGSNIYYR